MMQGETMRWSIIRLIWFRDLKDQFRDRRTLFMVFGLPLLVYPILGIVVLRFAVGFIQKPSIIGIVRDRAGSDDLPDPSNDPAERSIPRLFVDGTIAPELEKDMPDGVMPAIQSKQLQFVFLDAVDHAWLEDRRGDLILAGSHDLARLLRPGAGAAPPHLRLIGRRSDDQSRLAAARFQHILEGWKKALLRHRVREAGLAQGFLEPFVAAEEIDDPSAPEQNRSLRMIVRLFPFMLVLWSLAGALYPAVDICAGEKERGTMETLLITPAGRAEIVYGKFLTIWGFSLASALLNLFSMGVTSMQFASQLPEGSFPVAGLLWSILLAAPLSALFSAVCLAIGAYARSSKEGQYYLMPLFLVSMPLTFLTFAPGAELNPMYSMLPITGVALLMQKLMTTSGLEQVPWLYFPMVLGPVALYSWLALRWAIEQFNREDVLFREAERVDWGLWVRRLLAEKQPLPTAGQAFFAFGLILVLRIVGLGLGQNWPLTVSTAVASLAFVAFPSLVQVLMLNSMPGQSLYLQRPLLRHAGLASALALMMLPPIVALSHEAFSMFPAWLEDRHPMVQLLAALFQEEGAQRFPLIPTLLTLALIPAIAEELAFRGLILTGLHQRFRPRNAVMLSAFLYATFTLNVFLFVPAFALGVVLGLLTVRTRSIYPAMLLHFIYNSLLVISLHIVGGSETLRRDWLASGMAILCIGAAGVLIWRLYRKPYDDLERRLRANERNEAGR